MNLLPTPLNQNLAEAITNRLSAETSFNGGRSVFWRLVGLGSFNLGLGVALGIGLYGYSHITRSGANLSDLSLILSKELSAATFHGSATGNVQIKSYDLRLARDQLVSLDPNTRLKLDPAAKIVADGELRIQTPTITAPPAISQKNPAPTAVTNFTIFKSVPFDKGVVMTGWNFLTSAQKKPTEQYCYYTENAETPGLNIVVEFAGDGKLEAPSNLPRGFDAYAAFEKCVWFREQ